MAARASEPAPDAEDEAHSARALASLPGEIRRSGRISRIGDADIGREFPADLVTQPQAGIDVGKAGADLPAGIGLAVEIQLDLRLQDQPLRDEQIVGGRELAAARWPPSLT